MRRNPMASPEPIETYDEEHIINCVIFLLEFIHTYDSITDERNQRRERTKLQIVFK